jgi:hypothetical protein
VFHVRYELGFYIPEDDILHSQRRENLKSYFLPSSFNTLSLNVVLVLFLFSIYLTIVFFFLVCKRLSQMLKYATSRFIPQQYWTHSGPPSTYVRTCLFHWRVFSDSLNFCTLFIACHHVIGHLHWRKTSCETLWFSHRNMSILPVPFRRRVLEWERTPWGYLIPCLLLVEGHNGHQERAGCCDAVTLCKR